MELFRPDRRSTVTQRVSALRPRVIPVLIVLTALLLLLMGVALRIRLAIEMAAT